ncbi:hypothetical protein KIL84_010585 [Mauremys mutica]|uniref:Uncharacterized protein n=1 Tax=Mauremys mutica TaxID=74926 RepID=A0A9D3XBW8_9SAUR|nr:hypothetical protein KIL84_010585 [Mauremys mutica]
MAGWLGRQATAQTPNPWGSPRIPEPLGSACSPGVCRAGQQLRIQDSAGPAGSPCSQTVRGWSAAPDPCHTKLASDVHPAQAEQPRLCHTGRPGSREPRPSGL